jgi:hypothetical protein
MQTRPLRENGEQHRPRRWLRRVCFVLAGAETALLILFIAVMADAALSSDPLGSAIGRGMAALTAVTLVVFAMPALVLAVLDRWLLAALMLAGLAVPISILLWRLA